MQFYSARGGGLSVDRDETVDSGGRRRRPPQAGSVANGSVAGGSVANGSVANGDRSRRRRRPQAVAAGRRMCSSARVGEGEGAGACSSTNFGRSGALLGSSVAFGSGCG